MPLIGIHDNPSAVYREWVGGTGVSREPGLPAMSCPVGDHGELRQDKMYILFIP